MMIGDLGGAYVSTDMSGLELLLEYLKFVAVWGGGFVLLSLVVWMVYDYVGIIKSARKAWQYLKEQEGAHGVVRSGFAETAHIQPALLRRRTGAFKPKKLVAPKTKPAELSNHPVLEGTLWDETVVSDTLLGLDIKHITDIFEGPGEDSPHDPHVDPAAYVKSPAKEHRAVDSPSASPADAADLYVEWCKNRLEEDYAAHSRAFEDAHQEVAEESCALIEEVARMRDRETVVAVLKGAREARASILAARFERCIAQDDVARFEVTEHGWSMVTTPLRARHGGHEYRLGKFQLAVGTNGTVRVVNITDRKEVDGDVYDHPLVVGGVPLLSGRARAQVIEAVTRHDPEAVLQVLIPFLKEVGDRFLVGPELWPKEVPHEQGIRQEID